MDRRVILGERVITYELVRKNVKNLNMRIKPDGRILVSASPRVSCETVDSFVISRADFIARALERISRRRSENAPTKYKSGETLTVIGARLPLVVVSGRKNGVVIGNERIVMTVCGKDDEEKRERLFKKAAHELLYSVAKSAVERYYPTFEPLGIAFPEIRCREMRTRWGSCHTAKGIITLSYMLISKPRHLIDYVVLHELCHLIHADHSEAFYREVERRMPDYKKRRSELRK